MTGPIPAEIPQTINEANKEMYPIAVKAETPSSPAISINAMLNTNVEMAVANEEIPSDDPLYNNCPVNFKLNVPVKKFKTELFLINGIAAIKKEVVNDNPVAIGAPTIPNFNCLINT